MRGAEGGRRAAGSHCPRVGVRVATATAPAAPAGPRREWVMSRGRRRPVWAAGPSRRPGEPGKAGCGGGGREVWCRSSASRSFSGAAEGPLRGDDRSPPPGVVELPSRTARRAFVCNSPLCHSLYVGPAEAVRGAGRRRGSGVNGNFCNQRHGAAAARWGTKCPPRQGRPSLRPARARRLRAACGSPQEWGTGTRQ